MRHAGYLFAVLAIAAAANGQAITGFTGGSAYNIYHGGSTGDAIGYRFTVNEQISVTDFGVWNADQTGGMDTDHPVGLWDDTQTLLADVVVTTAGTVVGDWIYTPVTPVVLNPGTTYTIAVVYYSDDQDYYISSATSMNTDPAVTWVNAVYPTTGSLGLTYPAMDSPATSKGRFGPNFLFTTTALSRATWGSIKATWQ